LPPKEAETQIVRFGNLPQIDLKAEDVSKLEPEKLLVPASIMLQLREAIEHLFLYDGSNGLTSGKPETSTNPIS